MTTSKTTILTRKGAGALITIGSILALVALIIVIAFKFQQPATIAHILPARDTLAFAEMTIDPNHEQVQPLLPLYEKYDAYKGGFMKQEIESLLALDFEKDVRPWAGRSVGMALLKESTGIRTSLIPVAIIEVNNQEQAIEFLKKFELPWGGDALAEDKYRGVPTYHFKVSHDLQFTFINQNLVVSSGPAGIHALIDQARSPQPNLTASESFQKIRNNLPFRRIGFFYVDAKNLVRAMVKNPGIISWRGQQITTLRPYLNMFDSMGGSIVAQKGELALQQFSYLDKNAIEGGEFITYDKKYPAFLAQFIDKDSGVFVGGHNLEKQIHRFIELFKTDSPASSLLVQGALKKEIARYFGESVSLEGDIYPLLKGEYALVLGNKEDALDFTLALELTDPSKDRERLTTLMENFQRLSAVFAPRIVEVELEDGTKAQEYIANPERISRTTQTYEGHEIQSLKIGKQSWGVHMTSFKYDGRTVALISLQNDTLKKHLDTLITPKSSLAQGNLMEDFSHVKAAADELMLANFRLFDLGKISPYLAPFKEGAMGKNYFQDGISTIYTVKVQ